MIPRVRLASSSCWRTTRQDEETSRREGSSTRRDGPKDEHGAKSKSLRRIAVQELVRVQHPKTGHWDQHAVVERVHQCGRAHLLRLDNGKASDQISTLTGKMFTGTNHISTKRLIRHGALCAVRARFVSPSRDEAEASRQTLRPTLGCQDRQPLQAEGCQ